MFTLSKKKRKIKDTLTINQSRDMLTISGYFNKTTYLAYELWLYSRDYNIGFKINTIQPSNEFQFILSLEQLLNKLIANNDNVFDWYIRVLLPLEKTQEKVIKENNVIEVKGNKYTENYMRCGRFQTTTINNLKFYESNNEYLINYITTKGNLSVTVNNEPHSPTKSQIEKISCKKSKFRVEGRIFTRNSLINCGELVLRNREDSTELIATPVKFHYLDKIVKSKYGLNRYTYTVEVNISMINTDQILAEGIYDIYLKLNLHDMLEPKYIRLGRPTFRARLFLKNIHNTSNDKATIVNPYFTFKKQNLSLEVYNYPLQTYKYLRRIMRWSWFIRLVNRNKNIWIVGERSYKAQDTGYSFFNYMRKEHPKQKVYYVIDKYSPERDKIDRLGNILEFKSKEHIWNTIIAKKVISSHHPDYLFPLRSSYFKKKVKADKVFLQHGIMGTKNMVANYGKSSPDFDTDFFLVSSNYEKEMIVNDFGYSPKEVFITGLSRFDTLFKNDTNVKGQLLIIPTWRDWIITDNGFFESEYYQRYKHLVNDIHLHKLAKEYNFNITLCLHPNMQRFSKHFTNNIVKVINQGDVDVQHLIKESSMMLTDYSSVGFDFSFLNKPVIYYQFDRSRFIGNRPSHLDLDNELPGEVCFEHNEVLKQIKHYAENNFLMEKKFRYRANKFINYRDMSSSERIYHVVKNNNATKSLMDNTRILMVLQAVVKKFRKSSFYFPTMKLFYKVGSKVMPIDQKLILFESGLGKQLGDSPVNIYNEIINQKLDYKKVWVYNKYHRFADENTKRIKRLSPQYYYYLLRAGTWVNNQNFPTYIQKRKKATYLQTWHGTPLKKMLYDINQVQGRKDDYVERVGKAVQNWDYLLSPSEYASAAFRSAFKYKGQIIESGYPRNDIFYSDNQDIIVSKVKKKLHLTKDKKIILYAPTFRDNQTTSKNKFLFDVNLDFQKMKEQLGEDYVLLLRLHVVISNKFQVDDSMIDFVKNVSTYPDVQELLLTADILITDYSSVMFDFANTKKPMLFYTYDLKEYKENIRGFYINFEDEAPGPFVFNTDEVIEGVRSINESSEAYKEKYNLFHQKYCSLEDGNASKRVVNKILK